MIRVTSLVEHCIGLSEIVFLPGVPKSEICAYLVGYWLAIDSFTWGDGEAGSVQYAYYGLTPDDSHVHIRQGSGR